MSPSPTPTWYDVLGVRRDATPAQIKVAWREATDKFEPGTGAGQFRMFNEAADVLLDPERRREYDATLDGASEPATASTGTRESAAGTGAPPVPAPAADDAGERRTRTRRERPGRGEKKIAASADRTRGPRATRPALALAALLAVVAVVAVVLAAYFGQQVRSDSAAADARDAAPASAERAAKAMLSYNYQHLAADRDRAAPYLTPSFKKKYLANFRLLEKQQDGSPGAAVQTKTSVSASVQGSGVVDAEADTARVLVFVNQVSTRPGKDPQIFQNRVAMTMKKDGNRWLVDGLKSY